MAVARAWSSLWWRWSLLLGGGAYAAGQIVGYKHPERDHPRETKFTQDTRDKLNHDVGAHWGIIDRNTIGSPVADLRTGPYGSFGATGAAAGPPRGVGSLGIEVVRPVDDWVTDRLRRSPTATRSTSTATR